jgi:hypothetical protein
MSENFADISINANSSRREKHTVQSCRMGSGKALR